MDKALCYGALGVSVLMLLVFLLDLIVGIPFGPKTGSNPFFTVDILGVLASGVAVYVAWNATRDLK